MTPGPSIADRAHAFLIRQGGYYNAREVAAGIDCDLAEAREALVALEGEGALASREWQYAVVRRPGLTNLPGEKVTQFKARPSTRYDQTT